MDKIIISHRGHLYGPDADLANDDQHIENILRLNPQLHVEIDLSVLPGGLFTLGHPGQIYYEINKEFLIKWKDRLWIHCKNFAASEFMRQGEGFNYFVHDRDSYTLTSKGYNWFFPGKELQGDKSILLDFSSNIRILDGFVGVCTDYPARYMSINV